MKGYWISTIQKIWIICIFFLLLYDVLTSMIVGKDWRYDMQDGGPGNHGNVFDVEQNGVVKVCISKFPQAMTIIFNIRKNLFSGFGKKFIWSLEKASEVYFFQGQDKQCFQGFIDTDFAVASASDLKKILVTWKWFNMIKSCLWCDWVWVWINYAKWVK